MALPEQFDDGEQRRCPWQALPPTACPCPRHGGVCVCWNDLSAGREDSTYTHAHTPGAAAGTCHHLPGSFKKVWCACRLCSPQPLGIVGLEVRSREAGARQTWHVSAPFLPVKLEVLASSRKSVEGSRNKRVFGLKIAAVPDLVGGGGARKRNPNVNTVVNDGEVGNVVWGIVVFPV